MATPPSQGSTSNVETRIQAFITNLKRHNIEGSFPVAKETAEIMRMVISKMKLTTLEDTLQNIKETGRRLVNAQPLEFAIGNIVRRVLYIIRDEYTNINKSKNLTHTSSLIMFDSGPDDSKDVSLIENAKELKSNILSTLSELISEQGNLYINIADQAIEHIHANEVIMTYGTSKTVVEFFKAAARKRHFEVIIAECAPSFRGHQCAVELSSLGIPATLISDSAIFAMMARVNKVIVSTHAVMANGGLIAQNGMHMLALAAKHHSVPFVVCTGLYKLCPLYPYDQDTFNELRSPSEVLKFESFLFSSHSCYSNSSAGHFFFFFFWPFPFFSFGYTLDWRALRSSFVFPHIRLLVGK